MDAVSVAPSDARAADDARWMAAAEALARRGLGRTAPNPPVGAILVSREGRVVTRGWTQPGGRPHAERIALDAAGAAARGATLYVTLEPCSHFGRTPPCADAVIEAGVARVVAAIVDPDPRVSGQGLERLRAAGIEVALGAGEAGARRLAAGHISRVTRGRPHVTLKLAVSADGKIAGEGGRPVAITGEASRAQVHMMRAESDAILVGVGTVLADDPELTCRLPGMADRSPIRVVLDGALRTPSAAKIVATARDMPTWIVCGEQASSDAEARLASAGVDILRVRRIGDRLDLAEALLMFASRGITRLMVEGGAAVAKSLLAADLVDEAIVLTGPSTLGASAIPSPDLGVLTDRSRFSASADCKLGGDVWRAYDRLGPSRTQV
ncbi:bifunctional diaminohydroxyphosphoribosylaminopyrimidine deaminase/5-amino-6-(5-phosphoribosylamino)uracil reductase RibD [Chelatococcus sambhunathii]|uniref:Riboflavin biosynthesis protein RibD n=1 Tax=Chelatococcus sambhunathii TaxID=363953 RepID=A0ABU1DAK3_9HYPH|nr:bifunctional diaminohydroxyphosphoribosylaminopyrimidine deaminase/5-amino-6-(5-phosphoribosylamino)uracil reductase RibD [Chelatococcus sambhunathii]MDR4305142.1 bifunctional diaminohydroxyphosphoribosylaminopyrimidine deaminase/5-amino-6-(5-phosphoribosylamino)uracil reductase RibD [Chelatococcus sambhunathii]